MTRNPRYPSRRSRRLTPNRRRFLQLSGAALSGIALANCGRTLSDSSTGEDAATSTEESASAGADPDTLYIYTWADYVDDGLLALFTERTGYKAVSDIYDSNETMLARLQAGGGDTYSIIYPSDYMVQEMIGLDLLSELDPSQLEGMDKIREKWQDPVYDGQNRHSVPVSWGTTGLLYNKTELETPPEDWDYLWENTDAISGRLTLLDDMRETLGAVLRSLGYSYNSKDEGELEEAYQRLLELKPAITDFQSFGYEDQILSGDLLVVMAYSVDAIAATLEDDNLEYIVPASGSSVWTDTMVIPKSAPYAEAAYAWMNFMLDPEVAAKAVETLYFATPNQDAYGLLSDELKENKNLFPPEEVLAECEGIAPVGEATELYEEYWTQLTSA
ncbi:MAG: spermidine/putrescine ABC transporter substrate-binding protein [Elainellaceae cyanobacterium]